VEALLKGIGGIGAWRYTPRYATSIFIHQARHRRGEGGSDRVTRTAGRDRRDSDDNPFAIRHRVQPPRKPNVEKCLHA